MTKVRGLVYPPRAGKACMESGCMFLRVGYSFLHHFIRVWTCRTPDSFGEKENVADGAKAVSIIWGGTQAPLFSALESNHRMLGKTTWLQEWCGYCLWACWCSNTHSWREFNCLSSFRPWGSQDECQKSTASRISLTDFFGQSTFPQ